MEQVVEKCGEVWYKLYADDLLLSVSYKQLEKTLAALQAVSDEYELCINPNKCAIKTRSGRTQTCLAFQ